MSDAALKIGELAARTGVSVRALRHYEQIGLLHPARRAASGHRLYGRAEIVRLQHVVGLKQMGFSLAEIGELLDHRNGDARKLIDIHIARLKERIRAEQELCARLEAIAGRYEEARIDEFIKSIEVMTMFEKYYTKEQLETLKKRYDELGEAHIHEVEAEWPRLISAVRSEMQNGTDPKNPRVQALAKRWNDLVLEFTGGDPCIKKSLANFYQGEPDAAANNGLDPGIFDYIRKAMA